MGKLQFLSLQTIFKDGSRIQVANQTWYCILDGCFSFMMWLPNKTNSTLTIHILIKQTPLSLLQKKTYPSCETVPCEQFHTFCWCVPVGGQNYLHCCHSGFDLIRCITLLRNNADFPHITYITVISMSPR